MINKITLVLAVISGIWILSMAFLSASFSLHWVTGGFSDATVWEFFKYNLFLIFSPPFEIGLPAFFIGFYFYRRHHNLLVFFGASLLVCAVYLLLATLLYASGTRNSWI